MFVTQPLLAFSINKWNFNILQPITTMIGSVIVLTPNGRRQNVKVTPNTTILQVLEDVCKKHDFNADDYDVKHFNRVLDPNTILRFTGLPNNAQLEMIPCTKTRSISTVTIGVQLENGERLMGDFEPNTTLIKILQHMSLDQDLERTVLTYMHREVYGIETLKTTTLKSLGLTSGKAVLRLIYRDPQKVNCQTSLATQSNKVSSNSAILSKMEIHRPKEDCSKSVEVKTKELITLDKENRILATEENQPMPSTSKGYTMTKGQILSKPPTKNEVTDINEIEFLGERNALVFNHAIIQSIPKDELPDDFYDLTVDDAKVLLRDAKRRREQLEEAPLITNTQRQLDQDKRILSQLNKYRYTIIRIQFPDQFILQGLFRPVETVQAIKDFVKSYLADPNGDFIIFTTPPKRVLNSNARLINENLVPSAIVYYSGQSTLRSDIKEKLTDPKEVEIQVAKVRMSMRNEESQVINEDVDIIDTENRKSVKASNANTGSKSLSENKNKIPAWLNLPFK
ncbi:tether containing UBX domain for GLUT4 isoform X1 [Hylaeus anthracinus]|uniref:tether containing UBX domain for GLUT4 isoform X1 n=3 Tax=Hylaeus anthracinus TaxID=313031 RepID=UPI0023B96B5D|nr:tether containing UBX domain for GLUT4 isoform X1 [Hylaeus anthracinus]